MWCAALGITMSKRNPWKKLLGNVRLVAGRHNGSRHTFKQDNPNARLVSITEKDLLDQFHKQNGCCYWFGLEINPHDIFRIRYPLAMSVDRIDNERGYEVGNFIITTRMANLGRGNCNFQDFKKIMTIIKTPNEELSHNKFFEWEKIEFSNKSFKTISKPTEIAPIEPNPNADEFFTFD